MTEQEQYNLDLAKQEVEVNFYLQKKFDKDFNNVSAVSEEEEKNIMMNINQKLEILLLKNKSCNSKWNCLSKQTEIVHKYYNDLAEKYKINDILNKEYPQEAANTGNTKAEEKKK